MSKVCQNCIGALGLWCTVSIALAVEPLMLSVVPSANEFAVGSPIIVRVTTKNITSSPLRIAKWSSSSELRISVDDQKPLVIIGDGPVSTHPDAYEVLEPGQFREYSEDLSRYCKEPYALPPGRWSLRVSSTFVGTGEYNAWRGTLVSLTVNFLVHK
jgi:hypothetical protein